MKELKNYINEQLICERFINCFEKDDMRKYADEVWDILQQCYAYIGGVAGVKDIEDLIEDTQMWKLTRRNGKISACKLYKVGADGTRKCNCCGYDGTDQGKADLEKMYREDNLMKDRKAYGEFSSKAVSVQLRNGGIPIPATVAQQILPKKKLTPSADGWFYERVLGDGKTHHKLMIGNFPNAKYNDERPSDELVKSLKDLARKYDAEDSKTHDKED